VADYAKYETVSAIQHRKQEMDNMIQGAIDSFYRDTGFQPRVDITWVDIGTAGNPDDYIVEVRSSVTLL